MATGMRALKTSSGKQYFRFCLFILDEMVQRRRLKRYRVYWYYFLLNMVASSVIIIVVVAVDVAAAAFVQKGTDHELINKNDIYSISSAISIESISKMSALYVFEETNIVEQLV